MSYYPKLKSVFIADRLKKKFGEISICPITTVIAPVGYGKTTAINWWSKRQMKNHPDNIILRQIISTDSICDFWSSFSNLIKKYPPLDEEIKASGYPKDAKTICNFVQILEGVLSNSIREVYYIIDDLNIIDKNHLRPLLVYLSCNMPENLHLIVMSRDEIFSQEEKMRLGNFLCDIGIGDLRLESNEVNIYARHCELKASKDELEDLANFSEGWISMIYLNFKSYIQTGTWFFNSEDYLSLIDDLLFGPLTERTREFLILLSISPEFTKGQAIYMWPDSDAQEILESLTKENAFIRKDEKGIYRYHHILHQFSRQKFYEKAQSYQKENYSKLGCWYLSIEEYNNSYYAFFKAKDWDGLFTSIERDRLISFNREKKEDICQWLRECPEEVIIKYPSAITTCMVEMFAINNILELKRLRTLFLRSLEDNEALRDEERNNLLGDGEVAESFLAYNDISAMADYYRRANLLLNRTSLSIDKGAPWTFSAPSVFMMYHRTVGGAIRENEEMKECMPYYYRISDGHGSGGEYSFQAGLFYERGEIIDADISNRIALANAKTKNQYSLMLNSKLLSMRMAVFMGDRDQIVSYIKFCRPWLIEKKQDALINTLDMGLSYIYSLLEHPEAAPKWIYQGSLSEVNIGFPALPMLHTFYNHLLLAKKEWVEVIARKSECEEINAISSSLMCKIYLEIHQAAALEKINKHENALIELTRALDMAVPDSILMPFVESERYIGGLLGELREKGLYMEFIDYTLYLSEKFRKGKEKIQWEHWNEHENYGLSQRELLIAKLAAQRKTNLEIAQELHLAEGTIRNQLTHIFDKLNISGSVKNKRTRLENIIKMK